MPSRNRPAHKRTIAFLALSVKMLAQAPSRFDVATVKPSDSDGARGGLNLTSGGRHIEIAGFTLTELIQRAYGVAAFQVAGGPPWAKSRPFDLAAKVASDSEVTPDRVNLMLRQLLADRFALKLRHESRQLPVYALSVARSGIRFHEGTAPETNFDMSRGRIKADMVPMSMLIRILSSYLGRPVIDETGLKGAYNFAVTWTPAETEPRLPGDDFSPDPSGPSFVTALREQLGLQLIAKKGPVESLVIDHAEPPSAN